MLNKLLTTLIGSQRLSDLHRANAAKNVRGNMVADFKDSQGRWWYKFRDESEEAFPRLVEGSTHAQYMAAGLSAETLREGFDTINTLYAKGEFVKAGVVIFDMSELGKKILNFDALVNIIALSYIREDEDATHISKTVHQEKCDYLMSEIEAGRFFFLMPKLAKYLSGRPLSNSDVTSLFQNYQTQISLLRKKLSLLRSEQPTPE